MLTALSRLVTRHPRGVLLGAVVVIVAAAAVGGPVFGLLSTSGTSFEDPASQSVEARKLAERSGAQTSPGVVALVQAGAPVTSAAAAAKIERVRAVLAADPGVARVVGFAETRDPAFVSEDGRSTYLAAFLKPGVEKVEALTKKLDAEPGVLAGGAAVAGEQTGTVVSENLARAELFAFPILLLLLFFVFRSLTAALLPLAVGVATILLTLLWMRFVNSGLSLSIFAVNLVTGLGLGLAIDYSLLIVSRFREELTKGKDTTTAVRRTLETAGRTVLFSALTVAAALASLTVFPQRFLYSMGIGGILVALSAAVVSLVLLPAILALLGPRVNSLAPKRFKEAGLREAKAEQSGFWYRLSQAVMRRPAVFAAGATALLLLLGAPFLNVRWTGVDASVLPTSQSARVVSDALAQDFPSDRTSPVTVVVKAPATASADLAAYAAKLRTVAGATAVSDPARIADGLWRIDATPPGSILSAESKRFVQSVREVPTVGHPRFVGGETAAFLDNQASLAHYLPISLGILAVTLFVLLFLLTGSVILPLKALIMNLLTVTATFGILVLVFQDGWLEGPLGFTSQGALESSQPILLLALIFGLSTDYAVFLLSRIKEIHDGGASNDEAVALGLQRTGRTVTAAALLFAVAIGAFVTSDIIFIKELGLGAALAVLIDATIVRAFLVPSLMKLLGEWNWWAPRPLRRIHQRVGLHEAPADA
jgi:uncharacterized membrane protein YdfJ with MMPL/SSD domain